MRTWNVGENYKGNQESEEVNWNNFCIIDVEETAKLEEIKNRL